MRLLLVLLLLANLAALAWVQGWIDDWVGTDQASAREAEIAPQRLVVVPLQRAAPARPAEGGAQAR